MNKLTIRDIMRAGTVRRWHMVNVLKEQTLADHHYRVTMLARHLAKEVFGDDLEAPTERSITDWALVHDLPEVAGGDVPTPTKDLIREFAPGALERIDSMFDTEVADMARANKDMPSGYIVKLADLMESILFLHENGYGEHAEIVRRGIVKRYLSHLKDCRARFPRGNWNRVNEVMHELTYGAQNTL